MTDTWSTKRLGDVLEIIKGRKPNLKTKPSNGDLPYLVAKVMRGQEEPEYASLKDRNSVTVDKSEIIIICDGSNSGEVFTGFKGILSSTMGKISLREKVEKNYLRAFLNSTFDLFNGSKTGAAIPHLDKEALYSLKFSYPSFAEQQRIVSILDEAFAGIAVAKANAEKNLQNARALFESQLNYVFSRHNKRSLIKPLESVTSIVNGYAFKSTDFSSREGIKSIKITNVGVGKFICESGNNLPNDFSKKYPEMIIRKGSVVLALTRTIIAEGLKVALVPNEYDGALLNQRVASIIPNPKCIIVPFLYDYFLTHAVINYVKHRVNTLMQPNLSISDLKSMPVPVPPIDEQKQVTNSLASIRDETSQLISQYKCKLESLEDLKKSLLNKAFTGEL